MTSLTALFYRVSKPQRILIFSAAGLLILALAFYLLKQTEASSMNAARKEAPKIGFVAPDFELEDVDGKAVQLAKFRGENPVFLSFWASWCPACRQEAPEKEKLHQMLGPKGLKLLSITSPLASRRGLKLILNSSINFLTLLRAAGPFSMLMDKSLRPLGPSI